MTEDDKVTLAKYIAIKAERDELFARLADLSWETMSPREQAVWAAAFAFAETWNGSGARRLADAAVTKLREVLK